MNSHSPLTIILVLCGLLSAHAQTSALLNAKSINGATKGVGLVPAGNTGRDQVVIRRYANGKTPPAGSLIGWGPASVLHATAKTPSLPIAAILVTEDFSKDLSQWQANDPKQPAAILQPVIRDLTIAGDPATWNSPNPVADAPLALNPADKFPDLYDGLLWKASGGLVENVNFFCIPGTAAVFTRGGPPAAKVGGLGPFDNEKLKLWNLNAARCYRGFDVAVVDSVIGRLSGHSVRDYGLKISAGGVQIDGALHFWGGEKAVWFAQGAGAAWGGPIYGESAPIGVLIESSGNRLGPVYSHSCSEVCVKITGQSNIITPLMISSLGNPQPISLAVDGQYNTVSGGTIDVPDASRGVVVGSSGGIGLRLRDVRVSGNATSTLIDCTGTGAAGQDGKLFYAVIDVHLMNGAIGLDLVRDDGTSRLGMHNRITITTPIVSGLKTVIDLPARWDPSNVITVNGVEQKPRQ